MHRNSLQKVIRDQPDLDLSKTNIKTESKKPKLAKSS